MKITQPILHSKSTRNQIDEGSIDRVLADASIENFEVLAKAILEVPETVEELQEKSEKLQREQDLRNEK